jgi:SagB-type dehydrogenase family enzyme
MSAKNELQRLVNVLSEYECRYLLTMVQDIAAGERFWEGNMGILYSEYTKIRSFNTRRNPSDAALAGPDIEGVFVPIPIVKSYTGAKRVHLPASERLNAVLTETLMHRRSRRDYTGAAISLSQLSTLLQHACGTTGFVAAYDYTRLPLRSFPSSGGLQAPEVYLSVQAIGSVPPGLYHYRPVDHALESLKPGNHGPMLHNIALGQSFVETSAVVFVITGYYERLCWKYGERAYRYMCMDTGFLGQNVYLAAEALGLGACAIAGFIDDALEELLGIDGQDEMVLLLMSVGVL